MVKAVVGEESRLKLVEDRLSQAVLLSEIGLVIGKLSKSLDKGFVYDLIPTPLNDAGEPASSLIETGRDDNKKKGSKSKPLSDSSTLCVDKDWIAEHARQVSRMLLGGMMVIGVYISVSESTFKNSTTLLCQTVKGAADAVPSTDTEVDDRLLIHISHSPRRWTCRNCSLASNITTSSLRPCDFKMGKVLTSLKELRCTYNFSIRLPVYTEIEPNTKNFSGILHHGLSAHAKALTSAKCLIDGRLDNLYPVTFIRNEWFLMIQIKENQCAPDGLCEVEFLLPFMQDKFLEAYSQQGVAGVLVFTGSLCSFAYLHPKESILQALDDIKEDIIMSLYSRLDILSDEAEGDSESIVDKDQDAHSRMETPKQVLQLDLQLQRQYSSLSFPRRVFIPWLGSTYICDYILPSETIEVIKDHCVELMSMEAPKDASKILELESDARLIASTNASFLNVVCNNPYTASNPAISILEKNETARNMSQIQRATTPTESKNTVAFIILFISILVAVMLLLCGYRPLD